MSIKHIDPGSRMSRAVTHNGVVYTAGHVDNTVADVAGQTTNILAKLERLLAEAGSDKSRILSANIWLADITTFAEMNAVWDAWVEPGHPPARATVETKLASPEYKVEIAFIAAIGDEEE
jgi:enamine deaminase RidA (YjgF/YER057c/UK114 family)